MNNKFVGGFPEDVDETEVRFRGRGAPLEVSEVKEGPSEVKEGPVEANEGPLEVKGGPLEANLILLELKVGIFDG